MPVGITFELLGVSGGLSATSWQPLGLRQRLLRRPQRSSWIMLGYFGVSRSLVRGSGPLGLESDFLAWGALVSAWDHLGSLWGHKGTAFDPLWRGAGSGLGFHMWCTTR